MDETQDRYRVALTEWAGAITNLYTSNKDFFERLHAHAKARKEFSKELRGLGVEPLQVVKRVEDRIVEHDAAHVAVERVANGVNLRFKVDTFGVLSASITAPNDKGYNDYHSLFFDNCENITEREISQNAKNLVGFRHSDAFLNEVVQMTHQLSGQIAKARKLLDM